MPGRVPVRRQGSFVLIIGSALILLALVGGWFINHMLMQSRLSHRQGDQRTTATVAHSLAVLAAHHLRHQILRDPTSPLVQWLSKRSDAMGNLARSSSVTRIDLNAAGGRIAPVVSALCQPLTQLGDFSFTIEYEGRQADFAACGNAAAFPREKRGQIHLYVTTTYKKRNAGASEAISEDFHFVAPVKVVAALAPILSKFTLYVENATLTETGTTDPWRFNKLQTNNHGTLMPGTTVGPLVLDNGTGTGTIPKRLDELVTPRRGLVFLGGGPVYLNLGRGLNPVGQYGEGFHLFAHGKSDGLYTHRIENGVAILNWEQGMCAELVDPPAEDWWTFIKDCPHGGLARQNSILKLYGTDRNISVTLVLGDVARSVICARAYKSTGATPVDPPCEFLGYISDLSTWQQALDPATDDATDPAGARDTFALYGFSTQTLTPIPATVAGLRAYQREYASHIAMMPYNSSLAYIYTSHALSNPVGEFRGDPLFDHIKSGASTWPEASLVTQMPAPVRIPGMTTAIDQMAPLLMSLKVPGDRTTWEISAGEAADAAAGGILGALKRRGILTDAGGEFKFDPGGFVLVRGNQNLELTKPMQVISSGALVLEQGSLTLRREIRDAGRALLLISLAGDIVVDVPDGTAIGASLIARRRVLLRPSGRPRIHGGVAMGRLDLGNPFRGGDLVYNPALAALPNAANDDDSEQRLLTFGTDPMPLFLK